MKLSGVPLQAWREGIFRLLGDCLGQTLELDPRMRSKKIISHGRIKVLLGKVNKLSKQIPLLVRDLQTYVLAEVDADSYGVWPKETPIYSGNVKSSKAGRFH